MAWRPPAATVGSVGIAGMTLGGWVGLLARLRPGLRQPHRCGGRHRRWPGAGRQRHPDLLWALRGRGGHVGLVTSFRVSAAPVTAAYAGFLGYPFGLAGDVLRAYAHYSEQAPDRLGLYAALEIAPALPFIPKGLRGAAVRGAARALLRFG